MQFILKNLNHFLNLYSDGNYTLPTFENVTEDKNIVVTFANVDNKITINKEDKNGNPLEGAKFRLNQIEERNTLDEDEIIGEIVDNGTIYTTTEMDTTNEVTASVLGTLTNNSEYYFVNDGSGKLIPTNGATYQLEHDGIEGIQYESANSYYYILIFCHIFKSW